MAKLKTSPFWVPSTTSVARSNSGACHNKADNGERTHKVKVKVKVNKAKNESAIKKEPSGTSRRCRNSITEHLPSYCLWSFISESYEVFSVVYREGRPKSVIFRTNRLSTTQLEDFKRPWNWTSELWMYSMPCEGEIEIPWISGLLQKAEMEGKAFLCNMFLHKSR